MTRATTAASAAAILLLCGCPNGVDDERQEVYPVSGVVKLFGAPLPGANIAFAPQSGQPTAFGLTDSQGRYRLTTYEPQDGAAAGEFKIVLRKVAKAPAAAAAEASADPADHDVETPAEHSAELIAEQNGQSLIPAAYASSSTSPLSAVVKPDGENVFDFDLQ